jgi:proprotein convertase subtilisin/kexin type 5
MCTKNCPSLTYKSEDDRKCKPCDNTCLTCSGPNMDDCLTCPSIYYFYDKKCIPACPDRYFSDANRRCV